MTQRSTLLGLHTVAHPLVDACSMGVLVAGGMTWERVFVYTAVAFALQLPIGALADARPRFARIAFFLGTVLSATMPLAVAMGADGWTPLVAVCLGNALFHLSAGKDVLETHGGRGGPIGLFISTGALGLLAGRLCVEQWSTLALPAFSVALAAVTASAAIRLRNSELRSVLQPSGNPAPSFPPVTALFMPAVAALFILVGWRSWAGMTAGYRSAGGGATMLFAGAAVTWAGKVVGGFLGEHFGRGVVTAMSAFGSVALALLCPPDLAFAWLPLLFVAQLATGPVLSLLNDRCCRRSGLAFGLNCLALAMGGTLA